MSKHDVSQYRPTRSVFSELQKLFEPLPSSFISGRGDIFATDWVPAVDIKDEKEKFIIHADVPGVNAKDIDIQLENNILTFKGSREIEKKEEKNNFVHTERYTGKFIRSFSLPDTVDPEKIEAKCKDGILEVILHKTKEAGSRKINVQQG